MTEKQAIAETEAHWKRMVDWVQKQDRDENVSRNKMDAEIGECWDDECCPLCIQYSIRLTFEGCGMCPLKMRFGRCSDVDAENAWRKVADSKTWGEWLVHGERMLEQIRSL